MRRLVTGKRAKEIDAYTMKEIGIPSMVLMERAGPGRCQSCERTVSGMEYGRMAQRRRPEGPAVVAVCGTGNNGADGVAAARMLRLGRLRCLCGHYRRRRPGNGGVSKTAEDCGSCGVPILGWQEIGNRPWDAVIDAVFGVGLSREIEGDYRLCLEAMNSLSPIPGLRVAVIFPSGIHADTGRVMGTAFRADLTVTFGWEKQGTLLYPGREYAGTSGWRISDFRKSHGTGGRGGREKSGLHIPGRKILRGFPPGGLIQTRGLLAGCWWWPALRACAEPRTSAPWGLTAAAPGL